MGLPRFWILEPLGSSRLWREEGAKCYAQWLDDGQANWLIPDERMKKRRQHTVPLCEQALKVLEDMKSSEQYEHIFISLRKPQTPLTAKLRIWR
ncbi:hypothetical protein [Idiomarina fontislapidosi]|uniref:hypothetical protein n=1 Tax=Idiomarina fontislapidosi TaxID=263723 RepID=UPI0015E8C1B0|nr:hypothetical protein [Idiomarina fontislapidosi]